MNDETRATSSAGRHNMSAVDWSTTSRPLIQHRLVSVHGSDSSSRVTSAGPSGQNVSKLFPSVFAGRFDQVHGDGLDPNSCRRSVMS